MIKRTSITALAIISAVILLYNAPVLSEGLSGWLNVATSNTDTKVDGEKSSTDSVNQNYYLTLDRSITPMLTYQLNLRANMLDTHQTGENDNEESTYRRLLEPNLTFFLRNSVYDFQAGYTRDEEWSTARLSNQSRQTSELYFTRLNFNPVAFPNLQLSYQRENEFDHNDDEDDFVDRTDDIYTISSTYELPSQDLALRYYLNYTYEEEKTPSEPLEKTINNNFSANVNLGYNGALMNRLVNYYAGYQGYYVRSKTRQFVSQTGSFVFKRSPSDGLYAKDLTPETGSLASRSSLVNGIFDDATGIILTGVLNTDHNIGIQVIFSEVDRLYIYYRNNGAADAVRWRVYSSNDNINWNFITEDTVSPVLDNDTNTFRYEIVFPAASAIYFKAVNLDTVPQVDGSDVEVSEIEAYGTDVISESENQTVATTFNQKVSFNLNSSPLQSVTLALDYSVDRSDFNPVSVPDSFGGVFTNIFSDTISDDRSSFTSTVIRNYGASAVWMAHRLLTTTARYQRNESFSNQETSDTLTDTYNLSFNSAPLRTVDATLSLTKNERYVDSEKDTTDDSYILSISSQLYRNIRMINDVGFSTSESHSTDETTDTYFLNGSVDAQLTQQLSGNLNFGINRAEGEETSDTNTALLILNYRPGRFINMTGSVNYTDTDSDVILSEGVILDWLPLPALRLNMSYQHSKADPEPVTTDTVSGYGTWYLTKFADLRLSSSYTRRVEDTRTETFNFSANINCRF